MHRKKMTVANKYSEKVSTIQIFWKLQISNNKIQFLFGLISIIRNLIEVDIIILGDSWKSESHAWWNWAPWLMILLLSQ